MNPTDPRVLNMWCGPRSASTALMYAWRQRADTLVYDEPFYGLYMRDHDPGHPGRDEVLAAMTSDYEAIVAGVREAAPERVRFIKNIGHHLDGLPPSVIDEFTNALLIRDPARVIASLAAGGLAEIPISITSLPQQTAILDHELAAGRRPTVVDAHRLLSEPRRVLTALCAAIDVPFDRAMLSWPAGPKPEDGVWARYWYRSARESTGFGPPAAGTVELEAGHRELVEACRPLYDRLLAHHVEL